MLLDLLSARASHPNPLLRAARVRRNNSFSIRICSRHYHVDASPAVQHVTNAFVHPRPNNFLKLAFTKVPFYFAGEMWHLPRYTPAWSKDGAREELSGNAIKTFEWAGKQSSPHRRAFPDREVETGQHWSNSWLIHGFGTCNTGAKGKCRTARSRRRRKKTPSAYTAETCRNKQYSPTVTNIYCFVCVKWMSTET